MVPWDPEVGFNVGCIRFWGLLARVRCSGQQKPRTRGGNEFCRGCTQESGVAAGEGKGRGSPGRVGGSRCRC